jgi:ribosomal protein S18 acetylase RimI-like enzyme
MLVRQLTAEDAAVFQELRLRALREVPSAFASSVEEEEDLELHVISERLIPSPNHCVLGAFANDALIGITGVYRENLRNLSHKVVIWGMYVDGSHRGHGVGRLLLDEAIRFAMSISGVSLAKLTVNASNREATALYAAAGFTEFGRELDSLRIGDHSYDEILLARAIEGGT